MHANVPVRFGRGRLDSLVTKGLATYLIAELPTSPPDPTRAKSSRRQHARPRCTRGGGQQYHDTVTLSGSNRWLSRPARSAGAGRPIGSRVRSDPGPERKIAFL